MSELRIYTKLRAAGLTPEGAAAMLGNIWAESLCRAVQKQGDLKDPNRKKSISYMQRVDSGAIDRTAFGHDGIGWGLIQWTFWSRKFGLYDLAKSRGVSIGDEEMQCDYLIIELRQSCDLFNFLCHTSDIGTASDRICDEFERPAYNNFQDRRNYAEAVYARCVNAKPEPAPTPKPKPKPEPVNEYWPPRVIDKTMQGHDVAVLQTLLIAHGEIRYAVNVTGYFDEDTERAVKLFQSDHGLAADGVVGERTWAELLRR